MKTIVGTVLLLLLAGPQAAFASTSSCNIDDMNQRSELSGVDDREITSSLGGKGYSFDPSASVEFTMAVDEGSSSPFPILCKREVSFYGPSVSRGPILKVTATAPGLTGEWACVTALAKALEKVPNCGIMRKLAKESELRMQLPEGSFYEFE